MGGAAGACLGLGAAVVHSVSLFADDAVRVWQALAMPRQSWQIVGRAGGVREYADWLCRIELMAGLNNAAVGAGTGNSVLTARTLHIRIMLLRYRVGKTLLLWNTLLAIITALVDGHQHLYDKKIRRTVRSG
jgi:hypothetical protein